MVANGRRRSRWAVCGKRRHTDDTGGVWITVGVAGGVVLYAGVVLLAIAGFSVIIPAVVIPPVIVGLIGANSMIGGGRHDRPLARPIRPVNTSSRSADGPAETHGGETGSLG
jgi:hypothetical protein